jgi:hypothetical protein
MKLRLLLSGAILWTAGTLILRLGGANLLRPDAPARTLILFGISLPAMAFVARRLCRRLPPEEWAAGAVSLVLPTLLLDPFSSAFFSAVFPNIDPRAAGVFGGWMLVCCAGALAGVMIARPKSN